MPRTKSGEVPLAQSMKVRRALLRKLFRHLPDYLAVTMPGAPVTNFCVHIGPTGIELAFDSNQLPAELKGLLYETMGIPFEPDADRKCS